MALICGPFACRASREGCFTQRSAHPRWRDASLERSQIGNGGLRPLCVGHHQLTRKNKGDEDRWPPSEFSRLPDWAVLRRKRAASVGTRELAAASVLLHTGRLGLLFVSHHALMRDSSVMMSRWTGGHRWNCGRLPNREVLRRKTDARQGLLGFRAQSFLCRRVLCLPSLRANGLHLSADLVPTSPYADLKMSPPSPLPRELLPYARFRFELLCAS
jgi:hypothetical protein